MEHWENTGTSLKKTFEFSTFMDVISFVHAIAQKAEEMQHHPDMAIRYTKLEITLSTHETGGITDKDTELANAIDLLYTQS